MKNTIQQLKEFSKQSLFKFNNRTQLPLLNNDEILELLLRVKKSKVSPLQRHDISFRKIGDVRSTFRGHGMDYEESRQYQPGDDPRYMNWQLSARSGQYYMKVFREERQPGVFILIDRRRPMRFGTKQRLKVTQAVRAAAIAAFAAQENNLSIGGVILDDELEWFKENQNKQSVFDFLHQAARPASPVSENKSTKAQEPSIVDVIQTLNEVLTTGSTVYLISDFHDINDNCQPALLQLSSSHQVYAVQIYDPAEVVLTKAGTLELKNMGLTSTTQIDTNSSREYENYLSKSDDYFAELKYLFENIAIPYQQSATSDDEVERILSRTL